MSRRYGRKQRREHRAMIAERDETLWHARQGLLREGIRSGELERKIGNFEDRIKYWDEEIRGVLGEHTSFAVNELTFRVDSPDSIRQLAIMPRVSALEFGPSLAESFTYTTERILHFVLSLDPPDRNLLAARLTMQIKSGSAPHGQPAYYAMSESMWHDLRRAPPQALNRLAWNLARQMVDLLARPPQKKKTEMEHAERR